MSRRPIGACAAVVLVLIAVETSIITLSGQKKLIANDFNHVIAQNIGNISQDSVITKEGCGSGNHYEIKVLSNPKPNEYKDGKRLYISLIVS